MNLFITSLKKVNIEEKIQNAPDKGYKIGVFIGSIIPFIVLVIIAYMLHYSGKKRNKDN
jgi:hypothetical protein